MKKMRAIDFNMWMTLLKLCSDKLPELLTEYNLKGYSIPVLPAYPRDLTDISKPSIIIRKVDVDQRKIGMGNVIGQYWDNDGLIDVSGVIHDLMYQFDIVADNNTTCSILTSILIEEIFNDILINNRATFDLYDFIDDTNNPTKMGIVTIKSDPTTINLNDGHDSKSVTSNNNYFSATRLTFEVVQTIAPKQESIDLSKWIKITQHIKIKEGNTNG